MTFMVCWWGIMALLRILFVSLTHHNTMTSWSTNEFTAPFSKLERESKNRVGWGGANTTTRQIRKIITISYCRSISFVTMYRLYHLFLPLACLLLASLHCSLAQATSPAERYIVLQLTRLGLANRLRTLADMHRIAILSKRLMFLSKACLFQ